VDGAGGRPGLPTPDPPLAETAAAALAAAVQDTIPPATDESRDVAVRLVVALDAVKTVIDEHVAELGRIDAVAGDGDHGIGMRRGAAAAAGTAAAALAAGAGAGTVLTRAGDAWADRAGGTSGALWGLILRTIGTRFGDRTAPHTADVAAAVQAARDAVTGFGKATVGDKTMVDVLVPFAATLTGAAATGAGLPAAWSAAAEAADKAARHTAQLLPRMGRARPLAAKSLGTPDAGAVSLALIVNAVDRALFTAPA
jgi:dihydroxyacetone kinase